MQEMVIDNFAGGGGASTGIEIAIGRSVDVAINHDPDAIAMHEANHPETRHYCESVWEVDPREVAAGRPVGLVWLSPDCKHFSKAKGGKPVEKSIRGLAWVAVRWAATVKPRVIMLENVEEFKTWGPLLDGMPDPKHKGRTFNCFVNALKRLGYKVDWRELRACDYGAPTIRKRLFLVARRDGRPIVWPEPTHGDPESEAVKSGRLQPWRTAAEIIDWSIPCPSIFERRKPLAENTLRRIARGIQRFVIDSPDPFVIKVNHHGDAFRGQEIDEPLQTVTAKNGWGVVTPYIARIGQTGFGSDRLQYEVIDPLTTITTKGEHLLVSPTLIEIGYGEGPGQAPRVPGLHKPLGTVVAGGRKHALVSAFIARHFGQSVGSDAAEPIGTVTAGGGGKSSLVTSHLVKLRGTCQDGQLVTEPMPTITAGGLHVGEVRAFLLKYYGSADNGQQLTDPLHTVTTKDRFGLVTIEGVDYEIVDIGMRMLEPHELFAAQGFPDSYIIDKYADGKPVSKAAQVARCGNSVCPPLATALVRANLPELCIGSGKLLAFERYAAASEGQLQLSI
ncbi:DNA cytosine methyltransferase [Paenibacillus pasadenensis]|uniref:DNA cytosine methyltransferase n=1 Tax=Paenibacillus pasadenensis TaxID=217090 RepID=UPI0020408800|nr:DNA cytosine methyltransferase [Paenibacillus pasadenensis]MCM3746552.1 DNA cytosine methyltransferase [Paenibacillus pasadenensis]